MQIQYLTAIFYALSLVAAAPPATRDTSSLSLRDTPLSSISALEKRKGGGGGRSSGGGKGSGSSSGGKGSSSITSSSSNAGGRTISGTGTRPAYGSRYAGGATVPYSSGAQSPTRRIAPFLLPVAAIGFFPHPWLYPVYAYPYPIGYNWYGNGRNNTSNVTCLCQQYSECGCDPDDDSAFLAQQLTNSTTSNGAPVNSTLVQTIQFPNGTYATYINGTLDNGTTASGGTDNPAPRLAVSYVGYWVMITAVAAGVFLV